MYKQSGSRLERSGGCLLPGVVSAGLVLVIMVVFVFYSRNSNRVLEMEKVVEQAQADTLLSADNSQECSKKLKIAEDENKKKDITIDTLNKDLAEKTKLINENKKDEKILKKQKFDLALSLNNLKTKNFKNTL